MVMGRAYDLAILKIAVRNGNTSFVREEIAKAIIAAAATGCGSVVRPKFFNWVAGRDLIFPLPQK
jgi:hypothetical protein